MEITDHTSQSLRARLHVPSLAQLQTSRPVLVATAVVWALLARRAVVELF